MRQWWFLLKPIRILQFNSNIPKPSSAIDVRCFTFFIVQILKHCQWMEQQATMCFLLEINTKGHTTLGCSTAMNSFQSLTNHHSLTVFSHAISINWWLAGNLPGAPSHPFSQSYQINLEMIIRARQPSCCPSSQGSFLLLIFLGL